MKAIVKLAIEEYQCSGCVIGGNVQCYEKNSLSGIGCGKHFAGTESPGIGKFFLGMPKGFNRLGLYTNLKPNIYETYESSDWKYNMWNIPAWKHLSKEGHTFVRGIIPRKNEPFIHVFLENCLDKINCLEITQENVDFMN